MSNVYFQPRKPIVPSTAEWPAGQGSWFSHSALPRPRWKYCIQLWGSQPGQIQKRAIQTKPARTPFLWTQSKRVEVVQPGEVKGLGRLYCGVPVHKEGLKKDGETLFTSTYNNRTKGNGFKLKEGRFRLVTIKTFLTMMMMTFWNRWPREILAVPSLQVFKDRRARTLSNLV